MLISHNINQIDVREERRGADCLWLRMIIHEISQITRTNNLHSYNKFLSPERPRFLVIIVAKKKKQFIFFSLHIEGHLFKSKIKSIIINHPINVE